MAENTSHTGAPGNPVNDALSKAVSHFSKFSLHRRRFQTMHFGLIEPHMVIEGVPTDVLPLQSIHNLRTYTLSNILMSDVKMHKEYFNVNYDAILPLNWQKVFENPTYGDDVLPDVNCCIPYSTLFANIALIVEDIQNFAALVTIDSDALCTFLRELFFLESLCSSGSLLKTVNISLGNIFAPNLYMPEVFDGSEPNLVDYIIDVTLGFLSKLNLHLTIYRIDGTDANQVETEYDVFANLKSSVGNSLTFRDACMIMRERPYFKLEEMSYEDGSWNVDPGYDFTDLLRIPGRTGFSFYDVLLTLALRNIGDNTDYFNYGRIVAYQLVCAHYFTNDHVDYVYSSGLFEQAENSLYQSVLAANDETMHNFSYNGLNCQYDTFSGHVLSYILSEIDFSLDTNASKFALAYWMNLFTFRRSLRFRDYFTGAKPTPLALGDTNVAVNNDLVSIIDTTKAIASQRFLNQVNRIGRRIKDYIVGLFPGARVEQDIHEPTWLARTDHDLRPVENENTADAQYSLDSSVTSVLRSSDSRYVFECNVGRSAILIGVTYFDVPRAYAYSIDKQTLVADRFDMFIPQLQFIGDQPIDQIELGYFGSQPWAYTLRDMQYKQLYDIAVGGFVDNLPGWCFLAPRYPESAHISPDTIRSRTGELDQFYLSLTGFSLASYFHFILLVDNIIDAKRPMVYAPSIL